MNEVATYYQSDAAAEKEAKSFQEFLYDNESNGGVLNKFTEIDGKIKEIKGIIEDLNGTYKTVVGDYEYFTNLEDQMNAIITTMNQRADNVAKYFENIITSAKQAVEEHAKTDANLMDDLQALEQMLAVGVGSDAGFRDSSKGGNVPYPNIDSIPGLSQEEKEKMRKANEEYLEKQNDAAFRATHDGISEDEWNNDLTDAQRAEHAANAANQKDKFKDFEGEGTADKEYSNMNSGDYEAIADEIIRTGNYGNGEDRRAELAAQGIDYDRVQEIVNQKMNGTWDGNQQDYSYYAKFDAAEKGSDAAGPYTGGTASNGTQISLDEDPVSATSAANTRGYEKENKASEAAYSSSSAGSSAATIAQNARAQEEAKAVQAQQERNAAAAKANNQQTAVDILKGIGVAQPSGSKTVNNIANLSGAKGVPTGDAGILTNRTSTSTSNATASKPLSGKEQYEKDLSDWNFHYRVENGHDPSMIAQYIYPSHPYNKMKRGEYEGFGPDTAQKFAESYNSDNKSTKE